jgi:hypothetical protein
MAERAMARMSTSKNWVLEHTMANWASQIGGDFISGELTVIQPHRPSCRPLLHTYILMA